MKEYEIIEDNKTLGKIKIYKDINNLNNTIIETKKDCIYEINNNYFQTYIINKIVNTDDDLYDIISLYKKDNIFDEIDNIKQYNNIKHIKNNTKLKIIIPSLYLDMLKVNIKDIDLDSLLKSKIFFIKKVLEQIKNMDLKDKLNSIIINYNNMKDSKEYDFYTDEEIKEKINNFIDKTNEIIKYIEKYTSFRYGQNYITPILINN